MRACFKFFALAAVISTAITVRVPMPSDASPPAPSLIRRIETEIVEGHGLPIDGPCRPGPPPFHSHIHGDPSRCGESGDAAPERLIPIEDAAENMAASIGQATETAVESLDVEKTPALWARIARADAVAVAVEAGATAGDDLPSDDPHMLSHPEYKGRFNNYGLREGCDSVAWFNRYTAGHFRFGLPRASGGGCCLLYPALDCQGPATKKCADIAGLTAYSRENHMQSIDCVPWKNPPAYLLKGRAAAIGPRHAQEPRPPRFDDDVDEASDKGDGLDVKRPPNWGAPARPDRHDVKHKQPTKMEYAAVCTRSTILGGIKRYHFFIPQGGRWSAVGHHCGFSYKANLNYCMTSNWACVEDPKDNGLRFGITVAPHCKERNVIAAIAKVTGGAHAPHGCAKGDWDEAEALFQSSRRVKVPDPRRPGEWVDQYEDKKKPTGGSSWPGGE